MSGQRRDKTACHLALDGGLIPCFEVEAYQVVRNQETDVRVEELKGLVPHTPGSVPLPCSMLKQHRNEIHVEVQAVRDVGHAMREQVEEAHSGMLAGDHLSQKCIGFLAARRQWAGCLESSDDATSVEDVRQRQLHRILSTS